MINLRVQKTQWIKSKKYLREILRNQDNNDITNKLRIFGDLSRGDVLSFDGIKEWEDKSWADAEQNLKDTLSKILGIQNIKIERDHQVGDRKR